MSDLFSQPFEDDPKIEDPTTDDPKAGNPPDENIRHRNTSVPERHIFTVSELTAAIRGTLESGFGDVWVEGEISNCRLWNTGHLYFTLKDGEAQIKIVMFRSAVRYLKFKPEDGLHVVARGRLGDLRTQGRVPARLRASPAAWAWGAATGIRAAEGQAAGGGTLRAVTQAPAAGAAGEDWNRHVARRRGIARHHQGVESASSAQLIS